MASRKKITDYYDQPSTTDNPTNFFVECDDKDDQEDFYTRALKKRLRETVEPNNNNIHEETLNFEVRAQQNTFRARYFEIKIVL